MAPPDKTGSDMLIGSGSVFSKRPTIGKTKIIYVTKTISTPGRVVNGGGNIIIQNVKKKDKHKLSRLILA